MTQRPVVTFRKHADAVVRGDMDAVAGDLSGELRPRCRKSLRRYPQPVTRAEVLSVDIGDPVSHDPILRRA